MVWGFISLKCLTKVLDINKCWLQVDVKPDTQRGASICLEHNFSFRPARANRLMRTLIIRTTSTGELMVINCLFEDDAESATMLMQHLADEFPQITSLLYIINEKRNDTITDQR